ncbi:MAG TPA: M14 family zinc carboxypeptidase [Clostridia bacterium]|nr:M14 family zinc carboxypeptidase [Clostridia bacterium]
MTDVPVFWKTDLETVAQWAGAVQKGQARVLAHSAGGRPIHAFFYGEAQPIVSKANYSSACGAHDLSAYCGVSPKKPVIVLVGAEHGQETEGVAALVNLISLLETGLDLAGQPDDALVEAAQWIRLVVIPVLNVDGRSRVEPAGMIGCKGNELRYWGQGTWLDGSLCGWPDCKKVHPIKDAVSFLGGYYNDDGVNPMHDQFFAPMARETKALLDLVAAEHADCVLHLHGGSNSPNVLLQPAYVPLEINEAVQALAGRCHDAAALEGLPFALLSLPGKEHGNPSPSFNLVSAAHHVCGAVSAVFESNECIVDEPGEHLTHEQVYRSHRILFEQCMRMFRERAR